MDIGAGVPGGRPAADLDDLGAGADVGGGLVPLGPDRARVVATERLGVRPVEDREAGGVVEPALGLRGVLDHELGVDGEPRRERESTGLGRLSQHRDRRPRPLRVHVVGGHRRDATPVVDPRVEQRPEPVGVGEVRWRLDVYVGGQHQPGQRDRPHMVVGRTGGMVAHGGAGLGQEVLHDHLLHVTVPAVRRRDRLQRHQPVRLGLADADQDPGGEGDGQRTGPLQGGQPACGSLVRSPSVGDQVRPQGLDHHPLRRRHRPEPGELVARDRPGVRMGEQSRLLQYPPSRVHQVVHRRGVAVLGQPVARLGVPLLGRLAQGEQRLVAARLRTLPRDGRAPRRGSGRGSAMWCGAVANVQ